MDLASNGKGSSRPGIEALKGGYWSHPELCYPFKKPTVRDGHDAKFGVCNQVFRECAIGLLSGSQHRGKEGLAQKRKLTA